MYKGISDKSFIEQCMILGKERFFVIDERSVTSFSWELSIEISLKSLAKLSCQKSA